MTLADLSPEELAEYYEWSVEIYRPLNFYGEEVED